MVSKVSDIAEVVTAVAIRDGVVPFWIGFVMVVDGSLLLKLQEEIWLCNHRRFKRIGDAKKEQANFVPKCSQFENFMQFGNFD